MTDSSESNLKMLVYTKIHIFATYELCDITSKIIVMNASKLKNSDWFDASEYPFESKYLQIGPHQMHYIDEGKGPTILFIHGTPTRSFFYRKQIHALAGNFRCVAIDSIGFGLSEKP